MSMNAPDNTPALIRPTDVGAQVSNDVEEQVQIHTDNVNERDGTKMAVHILTGNSQHTLPFGDGNAAPLTARPFVLSRIYEHLVSNPEEFRAVLREKLGRLQVTLPQLGSDQLRQAKADMVYLKCILENEGADTAQIKAGAAWGSTG